VMSILPSFLAPVLKSQPNATSSATASSKLPPLDCNGGPANKGGLLPLSNHKMLQLGKILSQPIIKPLQNHGHKLLSADGASGEAGAKDSPPIVAASAFEGNLQCAMAPKVKPSIIPKYPTGNRSTSSGMSNSTSPGAISRHTIPMQFSGPEKVSSRVASALRSELWDATADLTEAELRDVLQHVNHLVALDEGSGRFDRGAPARQARALPSKLAPLPVSENLEPENVEPTSDNEDFDEEEEQCISMAIASEGQEIQVRLRIHVTRDMESYWQNPCSSSISDN